MMIDTVSSQAQQIGALAAQQSKEVAGERENDGDSDDTTQSVAKMTALPQISPQGVGTKVDIFA